MPSCPKFKALAFCSMEVESQHVDFGKMAVRFFTELAGGESFTLETSNDLNDLNDAKLQDVDVILMLNDAPRTPEQRSAFERYMERGGGWLGFHAAGFNDATTAWPWLVKFMGGAVFHNSNWPMTPVKCMVDDREHPITRAMPPSFISPANEWYQWRPSPRGNKNVKVLVSLSPDNYPLGMKNIIADGDLPVVWTHHPYRMVYLNMGHGLKIFSDTTQSLLIASAFRWLVSSLIDKKA